MGKNIFTSTDILLPKTPAMEDWSVIACDQFSSEKDYWERVYAKTAGKLSSVYMIVPEAYLGNITLEEASKERNAVMEQYLNADIFREITDSFIYVERTTGSGVIRRGLVGKLDLEAYDYQPVTNAPVRASEKTVIARIPPRVAVRRNAVLEMPHVMVLIDDKKREVIEPLSEQTSILPLLYDFDLMEDGGHIRGWQVSGDFAEQVNQALSKFNEKPVQIVIGDGNHSLASAKACWDEIKQKLSPEERVNHPARYALVEMNNVYDEGIIFEPIHRVVFDVDVKHLLDKLNAELTGSGKWNIRYFAGEQSGEIFVSAESIGHMIGILQDFLDKYVQENGGEIDYIHDDSAAQKLSETAGNIAFFMPPMDKSDLFDTVINSGVFPRKSFSIGHARDKRYYLECRKIKR